MGRTVRRESVFLEKCSLDPGMVKGVDAIRYLGEGNSYQRYGAKEDFYTYSQDDLFTLSMYNGRRERRLRPDAVHGLLVHLQIIFLAKSGAAEAAHGADLLMHACIVFFSVCALLEGLVARRRLAVERAYVAVNHGDMA